MPTTPRAYKDSEGLQDFLTFFNSFTRHDNHQNSRVIFQSYPEKGKKDLKTLSYFHTLKTKFQEAYDTLKENNYHGYSGNFCFNEVIGKKITENTKTIRCFVVDIDSGVKEHILEELIEILKPTYTIVSSRQEASRTTNTEDTKEIIEYKYKVHFYWSVNFPQTEQEQLIQDWPLLQQALAFKVEDILLEMNLKPKDPITGFTDKGITNPAGTLRVPGLIHAKDPEHTYLSRTVHTDESIVITEQNFKSFFNAKGINKKYIANIQKRLDDIKELKKQKGRENKTQQQQERIKEGKSTSHSSSDKSISRYNGAGEGDRHRSILDYCRNLFFNRGFSLNEVMGAAKEENLKNHKPPLEEIELEEIIEWCFEQYLNSLTANKRMRVERGDSFAVKDLIKETTWKRKNQETESTNTTGNKNPKESKTPHKGYTPFTYDYSNLIDFDSLISETSLAARLIQRMSGTIGLNPSLGSYVEDIGLWEFEKIGYVYGRIKDVIFDAVNDPAVLAQYTNNKGQLREADYLSFKKDMYSAHKRNSIMDILKNEPSLVIRPETFNSNPKLLHVANGTLNIETGELKEWEAKDYITMPSGVEWFGSEDDVEAFMSFESDADYIEGDYSNLWTKFVHEIMGGDLEMCSYLQKIVGYSLLGANPEELIFFLYGDGQNGKSVFIETVLKLLGGYGFTVPVGLFIENAKENKAALMAQLVGKRVIKTSEVKSSHVWDESSIKNMSGIYELNARALFKESFSFTPCFKTFVAGNHQPKIETNDYGVWRRIRMIPFDVTISNEHRDTKLFDKLKQPKSLQEILVWAVAGYRMYMLEGLSPPV